jgi:hypothetical protein
MRVVVYRTVMFDPNSAAPYVARIRCPMLGKKGKLVEVWHPVIFEAESAAEADRKATAWWDAEVEKELQKVERGKALAAKRAEALS